MTSPFSSSGRTGAPLNMPTPPSGWPIGSYDTYAEAQQAVDYLADQQFPVADVTIVGVDLMMVERITGILSWSKVLITGAASGAWLGLFMGLLLSLFSPAGSNPIFPILVGIGAGLLFGLVMAAISYSMVRGRRDFSSTSQLVAGRYDVLCKPRNAEKGRELVAKLALGSSNA